MPPLRSRRSARPSTDNRPDPPRRSALRAPTERKPASSASAGTGTVSSGGVLSAQTAPECPREVPGGKGGTCHGRKRQKSTCVPRSALAKAGALSWPSSAAAGAGCGQPPGGAERQPPALPARAQHGWASPQRVCEPVRPAVCPGGPPQSPVGRSFQHLRTFPSSADRLPGGRAARKGGCEGVLVGYDEGEAHRGRVDGRERAHAGAAPRESLHLLAHPHLDLCAEARSTSSRLRSAPRRLLVPKVPALTPANATSHRTPPSPPRD